jgi:hypothetical protein
MRRRKAGARPATALARGTKEPRREFERLLAPQVAGGGRGEAARMNDLDIGRHIEDLVAEEHRLLAALETKVLAREEQERLEEVQVQLDRYYDLLRQRRAREEFGQDPNAVELRPAETVERYLQ